MVKKVEFTFPAELKKEPIFYNIIKNFDVIPNIVEASFSTEMGWAIVKLKGKEEELNRLFNFLKEKGVRVDIQ